MLIILNEHRLSTLHSPLSPPLVSQESFCRSSRRGATWARHNHRTRAATRAEALAPFEPAHWVVVVDGTTAVGHTGVATLGQLL
jgi:hypothetical protein